MRCPWNVAHIPAALCTLDATLCKTLLQFSDFYACDQLNYVLPHSSVFLHFENDAKTREREETGMLCEHRSLHMKMQTDGWKWRELRTVYLKFHSADLKTELLFNPYSGV